MTYTDPVIQLLLLSLPDDVGQLSRACLDQLTSGRYEDLLASDQAQKIFRHDEEKSVDGWIAKVRLAVLENEESGSVALLVQRFCIGYAALLLFLQSTVTGPPLLSRPEVHLLPRDVTNVATSLESWRNDIRDKFTRDSIAPYRLVKHIELLIAAKLMLDSPKMTDHLPVSLWLQVRLSFMHQKLLSESSASIEGEIFDKLGRLRSLLAELSPRAPSDVEVSLHIEHAVISLHYGHDARAREELALAKQMRRFEYVLTGRLGKRTRYQQHDISQLVVIAKSSSVDGQTATNKGYELELEVDQAQPKRIDLNDDTLLDAISFTPESQLADQAGAVEHLPPSLAQIDPAAQPQLEPLDAIILLTYASSITNTSPEYGLTREETLPYATRVLAGGSMNWQVYTQALLVRSRIEGYSARTIERGLLQLQALVDQVIADTSSPSSEPPQEGEHGAVPTFLPAAKPEESASAADRLLYVFQLASPTRWELELELASRWIHLGGLRTALDIYQRLQMSAEAALCLAATQQEDKAIEVMKKQLYHFEGGENDRLIWGKPRLPPPSDAPRLYCILGDIEQTASWYEMAWQVSKGRYARAQRSLGRMYLRSHDYKKAVEAYTTSLEVNQLNQQSWFALGCALIELADYNKAVEAFSRCVQIDDNDAESWSNLGAALLKIDTTSQVSRSGSEQSTSEHDEQSRLKRQKNLVNALKAFKRASALKHDSYRIWYNILITAASVTPPDYTTTLTAQRRIVELHREQEGEGSLDVEILGRLVDHVISQQSRYDAAQPGLARMLVRFFDDTIVTLADKDPRIWHLVSRLALWRSRPGSALDAEEKAWRATVAQPGWELDNASAWASVVEATVRLCDAYERLGPQETNEGLAAGSGRLVAKDWKYKARSALKSVMSKARDSWEASPGWETINTTLKDLAL